MLSSRYNMKPEEIISFFSAQTKHTLSLYLKQLQTNRPHDLYQIVLEHMERPLFELMLEHAKYNQSKVAKSLGISRGTLRKKLKFTILLNNNFSIEGDICMSNLKSAAQNTCSQGLYKLAEEVSAIDLIDGIDRYLAQAEVLAVMIGSENFGEYTPDFIATYAQIMQDLIMQGNFLVEELWQRHRKLLLEDNN